MLAKHDVMQGLEDHLVGLAEVVQGGWEDYHSAVSPSLAATFTERTRASGIHDCMVKRASAYAESRDGVRLVKLGHLYVLAINSTYVIRLKKLDAESESRSQPTAQVQRFRSQEPLPGVDALCNLELGYVTDALRTEIEDIRVAYPFGKKVVWDASLRGAADDSAVIADLFPIAPSDGPAPTTFKPKAPAQDDVKKAGNVD